MCGLVRFEYGVTYREPRAALSIDGATVACAVAKKATMDYSKLPCAYADSSAFLHHLGASRGHQLLHFAPLSVCSSMWCFPAVEVEAAVFDVQISKFQVHSRGWIRVEDTLTNVDIPPTKPQSWVLYAAGEPLDCWLSVH